MTLIDMFRLWVESWPWWLVLYGAFAWSCIGLIFIAEYDYVARKPSNTKYLTLIALSGPICWLIAVLATIGCVCSRSFWTKK